MVVLGLPNIPATLEPVKLPNEITLFLQSLPKAKGWRAESLYQYQGYWFQANELQAILSAQKHFEAQDSDIIVTSIPRSGTIWLKSLVYTIVNRHQLLGDFAESPKLDYNPHELVRFLEYIFYKDESTPDLSKIPSPRLFATHAPHSLLPESIKTAQSRIVCIGRNPFDNFVSLWKILLKLRPVDMCPIGLEEAFDMYCKGEVPFGPYLDHMLGYWQQSIEVPEKVLFLKYEDMKEDSVSNIKKLAEFLGFPFTVEEEKRGVGGKVSTMCNFENLKDFGVTVEKGEGSEKIGYLRKGEVGDWLNYLTPTMAEQLSKIVEEKLNGTGLKFRNV